MKNLMEGIRSFSNRLAQMQTETSPCYGRIPNFTYQEFLTDKHLEDDPKDVEMVYDEISALFNGMPDWRNPRTMLNAIPPASEPALVTSFFADKVNANFAHDEYAGLLASAELEVVKYMADLVGWDWLTERVPKNWALV